MHLRHTEQNFSLFVLQDIRETAHSGSSQLFGAVRAGRQIRQHQVKLVITEGLSPAPNVTQGSPKNTQIPEVSPQSHDGIYLTLEIDLECYQIKGPGSKNISARIVFQFRWQDSVRNYREFQCAGTSEIIGLFFQASSGQL